MLKPTIGDNGRYVVIPVERPIISIVTLDDVRRFTHMGEVRKAEQTIVDEGYDIGDLSYFLVHVGSDGYLCNAQRLGSIQGPLGLGGVLSDLVEKNTAEYLALTTQDGLSTLVNTCTGLAYFSRLLEKVQHSR